MRKKLISLVLATTLLSTAFLGGCGKEVSQSDPEQGAVEQSGDSTDSTDPTNPTNLTFWTLTTRQEALEPIVEVFNAENPDVNVEISFYSTDGIKDALKVAASSKTLPDMWFNWGGSLASFYVENGLTYDLNEYAKENEWENKFIPSAMTLSTFDGKLSGYPTSYNALGTYYRKDIYAEHGLAIPTTFEEFEENCKILKDNGVTPISTAGLNGWHVMRFLELLIEHYAGPGKHDELNAFNESWDTEEVVQALTKFKEFADLGYFPNGFLTINPDDTKMLVYSGEAAMDIQGQWYDGFINGDGQDMELYDAFAFPTGGENRMSAFAEMVQFNAASTPEQIDASVRFLDFYQSEENVEKYPSQYNLPLPIVGATMPEGQPNAVKILELSNANGTFTITDQAFPPEVADVLFDVQDAIVNGTMTPEEGAKAIQEGIDKYKGK